MRSSSAWTVMLARSLVALALAALVVPHRGFAGVDDGQWTIQGNDYANTHYSALDQVTTSNVKDLKLAWTFSTGIPKGHEAAPLVVGDTMYVVTPFPNKLFALDLSKPGGPVKWTVVPRTDPSAQGVACCDVVNRGAAYDAGRVFFDTLDGHTLGVDAKSGRVLWNVQLADFHKGETITMAPLVVKGRVLVGNSGGEMGVRGWLTALDAATGKTVWRAYSTGPDAEVLIGASFQPHYPQDRGKDLGVSSWPPDHWKIGGGTVWGFLSYDPALDLLYYGTGNPGPWNAQQRPGDNKWTAGMFARRPETGEAIWFYQFNPHDLFDHDGINEAVLVDLPIGGTARKVLLHPDRNGLMYVLDRTTGEVLSAAPFAFVNSNHGVDLETGQLKRAGEKEPGYGKVTRNICPPASGGKDWQPSSWSPRTKLLYIPHQNLCEDEEGVEASYIAGTPYVGANVRMYAGPGGYRGLLTAWDPVAAKARWRVQEDLPVWSGALSTAGNVVFYGTMDGWFKAVDAESGKPLWQFKTGSGIVGQPMTYRGPDGKQYVAVLSGIGGWPGAVANSEIDTRDETAGNGMFNAVKDLPSRTQAGAALYVFALP